MNFSSFSSYSVKSRCIVYERNAGKIVGHGKTIVVDTSIIYMEVNSELIKTDDICGKSK